MARFLTKKRHTIGTAPGTFTFTGTQKMDNSLFRIIDYNLDNIQGIEVKSVAEALKYKDTETVSWINLYGVHDIETMQEISKSFDINSILIEEIMNTEERPKVIDSENGIFILLKILRYDDDNKKVKSDQLSIYFSKSLVFTFQEQRTDIFEPVRERIRDARKKIRSLGTDYLTYALLDVVVDNYLFVVGKIGEKVEELEEKLIENPTPDLLEEINSYKKEMNFLRKNIRPTGDMLQVFQKMETEFLDFETRHYLKTVSNNILHVLEAIESYREILTDQLNIYHTNLSSKMNDIMKVLTIFSAIFIPLTFIVGVYGTNFEYFPELKFKYSYFIMWGVMLIAGFGMLITFKNKKWF